MKICVRRGAGRQACRAESHLGFSVPKILVNFLLVLAALVPPAFAQSDPNSRIAAILSDLSATNTFPEVAMSPDGKRAAWVAEIIENGKDTGNSAIYVKDVTSPTAPIRITARSFPTLRRRSKCRSTLSPPLAATRANSPASKDS
jgi:hypothetical protein